MYESRQAKGTREQQQKRERDKQVAAYAKGAKIEDQCIYCPSSEYHVPGLGLRVYLGWVKGVGSAGNTVLSCPLALNDHAPPSPLPPLPSCRRPPSPAPVGEPGAQLLLDAPSEGPTGPGALLHCGGRACPVDEAGKERVIIQGLSLKRVAFPACSLIFKFYYVQPDGCDLKTSSPFAADL